ncbi:MAG: UDP-glucose 6-dehydrogenase [Candidatus Roizmanbacteria bacterium GW2011_GWC2_37_13]|uniref:UDP-glucose 6-dehydrogenase n=1 Tax=Candidatus Roizmanbacteria bacterium GW2011_GWC2_37_13 TaxID=1618486 RepID=A0A0G0IJD6_9BACT|nr:MAG: UDP-glucose 6-dehydrogenase [Candidatus Roizmanbacteria bacterium GW2011_GWC1_37_12]KKQ24324.1 MAG: UDP-glucose 6-dehydrogenase [Candidatus Roizmanbacteria bacterium GW2011_GWC2_37_13]
MTITIVGHGYVGLVTACVFADFGNKVWVVGHTKEKLARLKKGDPIIFEPGLKELLQKNIKARRIFFTDDYENSVSESEIVFIAVGTPTKETGEADLNAVIDVARKIGKNLKSKLTVVSCKSTVPVGTNKKIETVIKRHKPKSSEFAVASVPEFLREGTGIFDTLNPDRVIIGSDSKKAIELLIKLHQPINGKRIITNLASAEMIKYASNSMLATKISFANLISFYCEKTGANVVEVLDAVGLDNRIGRSFLYPGVGYGGSCLPKDVRAFLNTGKKLSINSKFLEAAEEINKTAMDSFVDVVANNSPGKKIGILGLSFKPNTDDVREAPSLYIISELLKQGFEIKTYDPVAMENVKKFFENKISFKKNPYEAVAKTDAVLVITEWNEFKQIDLAKIKKIMNQPFVFDGRNIYEPELMKKLGFKYFSIGRP